MIGLGFKANMNDIQAALLLGQLPRLAAQLRRREEIAQRYEQAFSKLENVRFPRSRPGPSVPGTCSRSGCPRRARRNPRRPCSTAGSALPVNYRAIHLLTYYRQQFGFKPGDFPIAEHIGDSTITIPLYPGMSDEAVETVIEAVGEVAR